MAAAENVMDIDMDGDKSNQMIDAECVESNEKNQLSMDEDGTMIDGEAFDFMDEFDDDEEEMGFGEVNQEDPYLDRFQKLKQQVVESMNKYYAFWARENEYKDWLASIEKDLRKARCLLCRVIFDLGTSPNESVLRHARGRKHVENENSYKKKIDRKKRFEVKMKKLNIIFQQEFGKIISTREEFHAANKIDLANFWTCRNERQQWSAWLAPCNVLNHAQCLICNITFAIDFDVEESLNNHENTVDHILGKEKKKWADELRIVLIDRNEKQKEIDNLSKESQCLSREVRRLRLAVNDKLREITEIQHEKTEAIKTRDLQISELVSNIENYKSEVNDFVSSNSNRGVHLARIIIDLVNKRKLSLDDELANSLYEKSCAIILGNLNLTSNINEQHQSSEAVYCLPIEQLVEETRKQVNTTKSKIRISTPYLQLQRNQSSTSGTVNSQTRTESNVFTTATNTKECPIRKSSLCGNSIDTSSQIMFRNSQRTLTLNDIATNFGRISNEHSIESSSLGQIVLKESFRKQQEKHEEEEPNSVDDRYDDTKGTSYVLSLGNSLSEEISHLSDNLQVNTHL